MARATLAEAGLTEAGGAGMVAAVSAAAAAAALAETSRSRYHVRPATTELCRG